LTAVARPKPLQRTRPGIAGHRIQAELADAALPASFCSSLPT
jgi:hypothetical protein